jgi:hypothetical protein
MVFGKDQRALFAATSHQGSATEKMKEIGANWKALGQEQQDVYNGKQKDPVNPLARAKQGVDVYNSEKESYKRVNPGWTEPLPKSKKRKMSSAPVPPAKKPVSAYTYI